MLFFGTNKISYTAHIANMQATEYFGCPKQITFSFQMKKLIFKSYKIKKVNFKLSRALA